MSIDPTQFVVLAAVIAGVTELISRLRGRDYWVAATIVCAAVIGGLFGAFHYYTGLDVASGVAVGFGASGALTALSKFGNNSSSTPTKVTDRNAV